MIQIIHNPGTIPDSRLSDPSIDITVVFEGPYQDYQPLQAKLASLPDRRSRYSYLIHSIPASISGGDMRKLVDRLSQHAEFLFLTDLSQNFYESFGPHWRDFIDAIYVTE